MNGLFEFASQLSRQSARQKSEEIDPISPEEHKSIEGMIGRSCSPSEAQMIWRALILDAACEHYFSGKKVD